ncbi:unnamed protein product, partial [Effrenium voratum]
MARNSGLSAALVLLGAACVLYNAVAPAFVATGLNRREALQAASLSIATLGTQAAWADAQGEPLACLTRYGPQILKLKDAVDKGDMETILKKEPKFKLLNSYWRNEPALFTKYSTLAEQLLEAADEVDPPWRAARRCRRPWCCLAYGPQILKLQAAVDKGDMETILKKEPKFKLLNSYWRNEPALFTKYSTLAEQLLEAADEGKKDEVKKLYKEYTSDPIFDALKTPIKRGHPMSVYNNGAGNSFAAIFAWLDSASAAASQKSEVSGGATEIRLRGLQGHMPGFCQISEQISRQ